MKTKQAAEVAKAMRPYVDTLLMATAYAQLERERVDKIQRRILTEGVYTARKRLRSGEFGPQYRVTEPGDYHMDEQSSAVYFARLDAIHRAENPDLPEGHCPALIAEHLQTQAEWALIEASAGFFPGVTNNKLLRSMHGRGPLENRQHFLDLLIKLVVNAPGYQSPITRTTQERI